MGTKTPVKMGRRKVNFKAATRTIIRISDFWNLRHGRQKPSQSIFLICFNGINEYLS